MTTKSEMKAGFARETVNPQLGTPMQGLWRKENSLRIREDLYVNVLALAQDRESVLIIGLDLLFFDRPVVERIKASIARRLNLTPDQILLNFTHNHAGPATGTWGYQHLPDPAYLQSVEAAIVRCAVTATEAQQPVTLHGGMTACPLPVSRRKLNDQNQAEWAPDPKATICQAVPVCLLRKADGGVLSVLFSASCHPSSWYESEICGDYPGVSARLINEHFKTTGALFLQGCAGDTKPCTVAKDGHWASGTWADVEAAGRLLADAVIARSAKGLADLQPDLHVSLRDLMFPLQQAPDSKTLTAVRDDVKESEQRRAWAIEMLAWLEQKKELPSSVPIGLHGVQLARGLCLVGLECEPVAEIGNRILSLFEPGITFPLGYTNGTQLYLPVDGMLPQHGYEVDSYWEYHMPSPLAPGIDARLQAALTSLRDQLAALPR
jgi:neutral ceramidase